MAEEISEEIDPELQTRAQAGRISEMLRDALDEWLIAYEQKTIAKIMQTIGPEQRAVEPLVATQGWMRIHAARSLRAELEHSIRRGKAANARLQASESTG